MFNLSRGEPVTRRPKLWWWFCGFDDCLSRYASRLGSQKTLRTAAYEWRTKAHETDDRDWLDWLHGLAEVRVASSNLVIRSREL
jgi:hypothetical protein